MIKKLEEICTIVRGSSPRPQGDPRYYGGKIPRLMVSDVTRDGMYVTPRIDSLTEEGALKSRPMKKGDIIIAVSGDPGEPCILNIDACIHDGFVGLRNLNERVVFPPYLYQYLKFIKEANKAQAVGAIYKNLNTDQIKSFQIPLPPLPVQQKIAAILDAADAYRQKTKALIDKYDQLAQSLFLDMFGDPVKNEKGWKKIKLSHLYINDKDGTKCGPFGSALKKEEFANDGIPVWTMDNIQGGRFINTAALFIKKEKYETLASYRTNSGDIIISRAGTVGKMAVVNYEREAIISTNLIRLRLDKTKLIPLVFTILMNNWGPKVAKLRTGADGAFTHMNTGILNDIAIALPPINLQNQFAERIQVIEAQKRQAQASLQKAEELFNSLLQRAFNGELVG